MIIKHGAKLVILASRSNRNVEQTIEAIKGRGPSATVKGVELDLSDLDSVRKAAAEILEITPVVDVLINNAGIMSKSSVPMARIHAEYRNSDSRVQDH